MSQSSSVSGFVSFLMIVVAYLYMALTLRALARKTKTSDDWMAWVPILNVFLMLKVAGKPAWWFILLLIPFVNIIMTIVIWMAIAERVGKPNWLGILMLIPFVNIIIPGYLAFSNGMGTSAPATPRA